MGARWLNLEGILIKLGGHNINLGAPFVKIKDFTAPRVYTPGAHELHIVKFIHGDLKIFVFDKVDSFILLAALCILNCAIKNYKIIHYNLVSFEILESVYNLNVAL